MLMRPATLALGALIAAIIYVAVSPGSGSAPPPRLERATPKSSPILSTSQPAPTALPNASAPSTDTSGSAGYAVNDQRTAPPGQAQPAPSPQAVGRYDLDGAEKLALKFQGYAELSGEYRVSADGQISIPVIGRISIGNLNASNLETLLAQRLTQLTGRETYVTAEILEYRNFFVSGFVARPGAYPWRQGQTVLHAVALAGGTFRSGGEISANFEEDQVVARLQKAVGHKVRMLATLARLDAERAELNTIETPRTLIDLVGKARATQVIRAEEPSLISKLAALKAKRAALARALDTSGRELSGLTAQSGRLDTQLSSRRIQKRKIDDLQEKGIVRADRSLEEFARLSDLEDRVTTTAVAIARIQGTIAALERDRVNLEFERQAELETEVSKIGHELSQLDIDIESERLRFRKITGSEPPASLVTSEAAKKSIVTFNIVRRSPGGPQTLKADQMMEMRPDDILVVNID